MPIASLESLMGRRAILPFLQAGSVDTCIIDPLWNGVDESIKMANLCELYEVRVESVARGVINCVSALKVSALKVRAAVTEGARDVVVTCTAHVLTGCCLAPVADHFARGCRTFNARR